MSGRSRRSDNSSSASSAVEVVEVDKESEPAGTLLTVDENLPENKHKIYKASKSLDVLVDELIKIPELKDKDGEKYAANVSADAQVLLLKKVTRLFLTKGAKKENIKRDVISKLIKEEMGAENTKYLNAVMTRGKSIPISVCPPSPSSHAISNHLALALHLSLSLSFSSYSANATERDIWLRRHKSRFHGQSANSRCEEIESKGHR